MGKLFDKINDWDVVKDQLSSNQFFKEIIRITHRVLMLMKDQQLKGFDLKSLLKVFDVKSIHCKDKSVYYFIMKQYLQVSEHDNQKGYKLWKNIPTQVFDKQLVKVMKSLMDPRELIMLSC